MLMARHNRRFGASRRFCSSSKTAMTAPEVACTYKHEIPLGTAGASVPMVPKEMNIPFNVIMAADEDYRSPVRRKGGR
jgi:hypothetical protein